MEDTFIFLIGFHFVGNKNRYYEETHHLHMSVEIEIHFTNDGGWTIYFGGLINRLSGYFCRGLSCVLNILVYYYDILLRIDSDNFTDLIKII